MEKEKFDCIVIGSGPGGYVAAIRAAQKGLKTALIEAEDLGGVCLNRGCIPSKTLIANAEMIRKFKDAQNFGITAQEVSFDYSQMEKRKDRIVASIRKNLQSLLLANKIKIFKGFGKFFSPNEIKILGEQESIIEGSHIIIATGSSPRELPFAPFDYEKIHDSTSLLDITTLPKSLLIIGGGVIGCEFASFHHDLGVEVTIVELLPSLISTEGPQISNVLSDSFKKRGIKVETGVLVENVQTNSEGVVLSLQDGRKLTADIALVSVGRKYNSSDFGLEKTGVIVEKDGSIQTDETMRTNVPHIYAIGDVTGQWILAHVASHQGIVAVDNISGKVAKMHYNAVPSVIFTHPEIATIGLTLDGAFAEGYDAKIGSFPFQALGKSLAIAETEGFAQIVIDKATGQILGAQVVGYGASTLIAEMAVAITNELTVDSISETIHAHPTISEAWMEAALAAYEKPLHMPPKSDSNTKR